MLLVNGLAMCSQEKLQGDKSQPPSALNGRVKVVWFLSHLFLQQTHFTSIKIIPLLRAHKIYQTAHENSHSQSTVSGKRNLQILMPVMLHLQQVWPVDMSSDS